MRLRQGTSIIEIVIAASLISMAVIAALSLSNRSQRQNAYAKDLAEATKYASQGADWIRTQRNLLGWATINTLDSGIYCLNSFPADFTLITAGTCDSSAYIQDTRFQRQLELTKNTDNIKVVIEVAWQEQIERQATIEMELTKW